HHLDALSSFSPFSQLSQPPAITPASSPTQILQTLFRDSSLSPKALALLTQIILRDIRPLLSPLPKLLVRNPTVLLRMKSNTGPPELNLHDAVNCWDERLWGMYTCGSGDLDWCFGVITSLGREKARRVEGGPVLGVNVQIPKCLKGRSISDALKEFSGTSSGPSSRAVWAETKYDGYRIVLAALGLKTNDRLPQHSLLAPRSSETKEPRRKITKSIILEAEVVPYNDGQREGHRGKGIEEFWWLGPAGVSSPEENGLLRHVKDRDRHLCLVFFDCLSVDGESLLDWGYERRREILEDSVREVPGFSVLVDRIKIPMHLGKEVAGEALEAAFHRSNELRQEGLVLKAAESTYSRMRYRWVKLKKDYIPNLGDCIDLVILGAGWDIDRARELRVDTSVFTTFYMGVLTNQERVTARAEVPHFEILFRVSYGMDRSQLEIINENIRHGRWKSKPFDKDDPFKQRLLGLSWTYKLPKGITPPSVLFEQPLCGEVMGAGFQNVAGSEYFELRWPRLQKIFDPRERNWVHCMSAKELISTAHASLGYRHSPISSPQDDSIRSAWRFSSQLPFADIPDSTQSNSKRLCRAQTSPVIEKRSPRTPEMGRRLQNVIDLPFPTPSPYPLSKRRRSVTISPPMWKLASPPVIRVLPVRKERKLKALSLRSRIRIASRLQDRLGLR
ncbi:hypothetical protein P7C73_g2995, partial [Tremellales sp. Uapishka_1]